jgi:hypothetical protein
MSKKAKKGDKGDAQDALKVRVSAHPRAQASIRRARGMAGIAGFLIVGLLALQAGLPTFDVLLRALAGGIAAHFIAWVAALALWRRLIVAELEVHRRRMTESDDDDAAAAA